MPHLKNSKIIKLLFLMFLKCKYKKNIPIYSYILTFNLFQEVKLNCNFCDRRDAQKHLQKMYKNICH